MRVMNTELYIRVHQSASVSLWKCQKGRRYSERSGAEPAACAWAVPRSPVQNRQYADQDNRSQR